jgi:hypothetical protein
MSLGSVALEGGGRGEALMLEGEVLRMVLDRALPPGTPIVVTLARAELELRLQGKTLGSKRLEDGRYEVRVRLVNLRREDRVRLRS